MNMEIHEQQKTYHLNSLDDEYYPWVLAFLGIIALGLFISSIFLFHFNHWIYGISFLLSGLIIGSFVAFCSRRCFLSRRENKIKKERG
jgi:hypothetical protein